jgi:hypothetical protein
MIEHVEGKRAGLLQRKEQQRRLLGNSFAPQRSLAGGQQSVKIGIFLEAGHRLLLFSGQPVEEREPVSGVGPEDSV